MAALITGALAPILEAERDTINERVEEARRADPTFDPAAFTAVLVDVVAPMLDAVEQAGRGFTALVGQVLVDVALDLCAGGRFSPAIRTGWVELLPALLPRFAEEPRPVVAMVSNALDNLDRTAGGDVRTWIDRVAAVTHHCGTVEELRGAGLVAGWRAGLAGSRVDALALARALTPTQLLAVLDAAPADLDRLAEDPWFDPSVPPGPSAPPAPVRVVGFRGFGGPFLRPPTVALLDGDVVATDGTGTWAVFADAFGTALHRIDPSGPGVSGTGPPPPEAPAVDEATSWVDGPAGPVVTSALTHHVLYAGTRR